MTYSVPVDFVKKAIDAGESKALMQTQDMLIRAFMAGGILALAAAFAITISVQTGIPLLGAALFPVGFCMLYLMGFDLLTGVFTLVPLAFWDGRQAVTLSAMLRNWMLVFIGNFAGALTVALMMAVVLTFGFSVEPNTVGLKIGSIGVDRTLGYASHGMNGMLTLFVRAVLCNWMVSTAVVTAFMSSSVGGKVIMMWMPIMIFFYMGFEHSVVNMFLFPAALMLGGDFSVRDYLVWNEFPTIFGNFVGGPLFVGLPLYLTFAKKEPQSTADDMIIDRSVVTSWTKQ